MFLEDYALLYFILEFYFVISSLKKMLRKNERYIINE